MYCAQDEMKQPRRSDIILSLMCRQRPDQLAPEVYFDPDANTTDIFLHESRCKKVVFVKNSAQITAEECFASSL